MKNEFNKYCVERPYDWHSYEIGEYHISDIGNSHEDLSPKEHYGPCLRNLFWEYNDPEDFSSFARGNFFTGNLWHEELQRIRIINQPLTIAEFPIYEFIDIEDDKVAICGKADLVEFFIYPEKKILRVSDIKTASAWTMPTSEYEFNPTYITQIYLYTYILVNHYFKQEFDEIQMEIIYVKKSNAEIGKQRKIYDPKEAKKIYNSFINRVKLFHELLLLQKLPLPEPMKWCKYCKYLERCKETGDIEYDKEKRCYVKKVEYLDD